LRRAVGAKRGRGLVLLKSAPKPENKTYNHFTPIKGQASALRQRSFIRALQHSMPGSEPRGSRKHGRYDKAISPTYFNT
ncbi:MAG: hypothetical protein ABSD42_13725, partial [Candidatus Bathyarchaeia archaeon]